MQLRLRTKLTLVMTGLVLLVVAVLSGVFLAQLLQQTLLETDKRASDLAHQVFVQAQHALTEAASKGLRPSSDDPDDVHDYVRRAFEINAGLQAQLEAAISSPSVYEVSITDDDGQVLISNDESLPGKTQAAASSAFAAGAERIHAASKSFARELLNFTSMTTPSIWLANHSAKFASCLSSGLLLHEIAPSLKTSGTIVLLALVISALLAAVVSGATLAPLRDISAQLDRISAGQYDAPTPDRGVFGGSSDELGQVSRKITQVGQQLRGVHEIFSTLRENMNSVMAGLEDGLLLFTRDARAVMVSPAAEKFLGASSGEFLGRRAAEIFPEGHPLRAVLHLEGDELSEVAAETELATAAGFRRVGVSVQAIQEGGERMGALVTLRDLDSLESINTQLQVSERLAALGRITAGVAHEVKNPLNSMRFWLENLKESLPPDQDAGAMQAVNVLDKEIDRLDAVVKRFLDLPGRWIFAWRPRSFLICCRKCWSWRNRSCRKQISNLRNFCPSTFRKCTLIALC